MEGTRPLLVEFQALVAPSSLGTPRRAVVGWEPSRLSMVIAVLEAHAGLKLGQHDVYLNVAGGLRITEPAADVAAAAALVSSLAGAPLPPDRVYMGEIGLTGALRPVSQSATRLKEAAKLGFQSALGSAGRLENAGRPPIRVETAGDVAELVAGIACGSCFQARKRRARSTPIGGPKARDGSRCVTGLYLRSLTDARLIDDLHRRDPMNNSRSPHSISSFSASSSFPPCSRQFAV